MSRLRSSQKEFFESIVVIVLAIAGGVVGTDEAQIHHSKLTST